MEQENLIEQEIQAQQAYINRVYSRRVPPPVKESTSFWSIVGVDASLFTLTALASAVLSSIRTGGLFYILEQELLKEFAIPDALASTLSFISLVVSLVAFEGFLLAVGFSTGRRNNKIRISRWGIFLAFLVVLSAGVFSGLGIVEIPDATRNGINISLAIVTAVSSAFITYFGGENIGFSFAIFERRRKEIEAEYQEEFNTWNEGAIKSYQSSKYNILSKNYIGHRVKEEEQEQDFEVEENEDEEPESYHYVRDFKNAYTNEDKFEIWKQGRAFLKNKFPNLSDVQTSRWWSNLERDLVDVGFLEYEEGSGSTISKKSEPVIEEEDNEDW